MEQIIEVWKLSEEEYREIEDLFEKKVALENLAKILDPDNERLYEKLIKDYGRAVRQFENWWTEMGKKHQWKGSEWWLDFETKTIMGKGKA